MKIALSFSSKDRCELTNHSLARIVGYDNVAVFWNDGSVTDDGKQMHQCYSHGDVFLRTRVTGGPDSAIVFALSQMLSDPSFTHMGLLENDVALDYDWYEDTLALFNNQEGLPVGAVSARSFVDRVLLQRNGYCVLHNAGAGFIIFTREAAEIILNNYRTGWWPENRAVFSQLSGIDIGKFAAFHHNEQCITADWSWDTILASHGLATVALTPSKANMIGQELTLEQQGLRLTQADVEKRKDDLAFALFKSNLQAIRNGERAIGPVDHLLRTRGGHMIMPHHAEKHGGLFSGNWTTRWNQACGPFVYVAAGTCQFSIPVFGPCAFHVGGGPVTIDDIATGFNNQVDLTGQTETITLPVPRDMQSGIVRLTFAPGAFLSSIETVQPQPVWKDVTFDFSKLPPVEEKSL